MTTSVKLRTNGSYVSELKRPDGTIVGSAGPGDNVESEWLNFPHGYTATIEERSATAEEIAAAAEAKKAAADSSSGAA